MQTIVQLGSFFGAMASGYLLLALIYNNLISPICIFDIIISSMVLFIVFEKSVTTIEKANRPRHLSVPFATSLIYLWFIFA